MVIVRVEQLYPLPYKQLEELYANYNKATWFWVQEEPKNMGGWQFVRPRLNAASQKSFKYIGRKASSSPASGFPSLAKSEQQAIVAKALGPPAVRKGKGRAAAG